MKKLPPPLLMLVGIGLEWLLNQYLPIVNFGSTALHWIGYAALIVAILLAVTSLRLFTTSPTTLAPHKNPEKLIVNGPYNFSRNPMYFALTCLLIGIAAFLESLSGFIIPLVFCNASY
jgi:protein-S-isoprenylcysteine O-methyltransferase Ste14